MFLLVLMIEIPQINYLALLIFKVVAGVVFYLAISHFTKMEPYLYFKEILIKIVNRRGGENE